MISRTCPCILIALASVLFSFEGIVDAYSPRSKYRIQQTHLLASHDTSQGPIRTPQLSKTNAPASTLPIAHDEDHRMLWLGDLRSIFQPISLLISMSLLVAICLVGWEDYAGSNLWPSRHMLVITSTKDSSSPQYFGSRTIQGLGFGRSQRLQILQEDTSSFADSLLPEIRGYNEVLEEHRLERVARWQDPLPTTSTMEVAVADLQDILLRILQLQTLVGDYQWEQVHSMIQTTITPKLEPSASVIRRYLAAAQASKPQRHALDGFNVAYEEIGFDWGSCAWRHCGALADAQEALDELDHLLGILEPPECLFCLNIAERSIREMLAVVPPEFHATAGIPAYTPYQSLRVRDDTGEFGDETDILDIEYLRMLQELRSSNTGDD